MLKVLTEPPDVHHLNQARDVILINLQRGLR